MFIPRNKRQVKDRNIKDIVMFRNVTHVPSALVFKESGVGVFVSLCFNVKTERQPVNTNKVEKETQHQ